MSDDEPLQQNPVLIVDDDAPTRQILRGVLARQGLAVIEAADGAEAIALFARHPPSLVLLDVMMPVLDGFTTCARMRELDNHEGTPIVMLTGADDLASIERAFDVGATDFITKPIKWTLLTQRVRYALRAGRLYREVRQSRLRQASARRIARLVFWEWRLSDDTLTWSDDLEPLIGIPSRQLGKVADFLSLVHPEDLARVERLLALARAQTGVRAEPGAPIEIELRLLTSDRERVVRLVGERGLEGSDNDLIVGAFQDITDQRQAEALVDYLAFHDELTGLGNRRLFLGQVSEAIESLGSGPGADGRLLVGWLDIGAFHRHNEALGDRLGDLLLSELARRLRRLVGGSEWLARVGGDEFALMLRGSDCATTLERFEAILANLRRPFQVGGQETILTFSCGVACCPDHGSDANQLLTEAQDAQRTARVQARPIVIATPGERSSARVGELLALERALHKALEQQEFFLVYQPQMDLRSGRIVGVEALLRWQHPTLGLVSPVRFIPLLEQLDLISPVGRWVLEEACRQSCRWRDTGLELRVGVNLSPRQFLERQLFEQILAAIEAAGANPGTIELEITESLAMQDPTRAIRLLERLRETRVKIAIDDFGVGHSSLEYLLRFPIDTIKIDRAFVTHITSIQADRAIVRAVTAIGQTLGVTIIAEGVETLRQCDFLEALGVTEIQGYLIGKPMPAEALAALARDFSRPGSAEPPTHQIQAVPPP